MTGLSGQLSAQMHHLATLPIQSRFLIMIDGGGVFRHEGLVAAIGANRQFVETAQFAPIKFDPSGQSIQNPRPRTDAFVEALHVVLFIG